MSETSLFQGTFFDYLMQQEPLCSTEYFAHGSSAMLFQRDGKLYRLTLDGCGYNFLVEESARENPNVMRIIHDYGAVAPSDTDTLAMGECYWLAEVEWLHDLDTEDATTQRLQALLAELTGDEPIIEEPDLPALVERCHVLAEQHPEFAALLHTLAKAAGFGGDADVHISNIMCRTSTGELVWSDPLYGTMHHVKEYQLARLEALRQSVGKRQLLPAAPAQ